MSWKDSRSTGRRGFTLLEAMIALVILGLIVTASLQLFGSALRATHTARAWTTATAYAEEGMELAKLDLAGAVGRGPETLEGGFGRQIRVRAWAGGQSEVIVSVTFPDGGRFELGRLVGRP